MPICGLSGGDNSQLRKLLSCAKRSVFGAKVLLSKDREYYCIYSDSERSGWTAVFNNVCSKFVKCAEKKVY